MTPVADPLDTLLESTSVCAEFKQHMLKPEAFITRVVGRGRTQTAALDAFDANHNERRRFAVLPDRPSAFGPLDYLTEPSVAFPDAADYLSGIWSTL